MATTETTEKRGYPLPVSTNLISEDVVTLRLALQAVDEDVDALLIALSDKAALVHGHEIADIDGLEAALGSKSSLDHAHSINDLTDVTVASGAPVGSILVLNEGGWIVGNPAAVLGVHEHIIENVQGLQSALDAKAPLASPSLTGTPTAPTAAAGTDTSQVATTAFISSAVAKRVRADAEQPLTDDEKAQARANVGLETTDFFIKASKREVAFTRPSNGAVSVKPGTIVAVGGKIYTYHNAEPIVMPALSGGDDVAFWIRPDGQPVASLDHVTPPVAGARIIGGGHYAPGGNATGYNTGGDTTPQFNPFSLWDEKFRPACPDASGMTLVAEKDWVDIYLCGANHHVDGTSKHNVLIADGASPAKVPDMFGGNGLTTYATFNQWEAAEVMHSHGKELLNYNLFTVAAFGTSEGVDGGTDPVNTILRSAFTSIWGVMLASGNMWVWGRDFSYRTGANAGFAWRDQAGGRGQLYLENDTGLVASLFGGGWGDGVDAGSRASNWSNCPWYSSSVLGARGRSDHLNHV